MSGPALTTPQAGEAAPPPPPRGPRRPILFLGIGVALAALLAVVLFAGIGTSGTGNGGSSGGTVFGSSTSSQAAGLNQLEGQLLTLETFPPGSEKLAPGFQLVDQHGRNISLSQYRGDSVVLSFNDDECTDLCTLLAQDVVLANHDLGAAARHVVWLSVNANPFYPQVSAVRQWTNSHDLGGLATWEFGTADPATLAAIWQAYGISVDEDTVARTVTHGTEMFYIDPSGHERAVTQFGVAAASTALFAHGIAQLADDYLPSSQRVHVGGSGVPSSGGGATVGALAPDFTLPLLGGSGRLSLASLRGRTVVLNFWASTCSVCRSEGPALEAAYRSVLGDGEKVAFVGIDVSDATGAARAMAAAAGLTYPVVADHSGVASGGEAITGLPYTVILNSQGIVVVRHPGGFTTEQLKYVLESGGAG